MIFTETPLAGAYVIATEPREDARGAFTRTWCRREFEARGLETRIAQCSTSFTRRKGTLRGLHFQAPPFEETKLVRCTRGAIYDVIVDLRPESPTFMRHFAVLLTPGNGLMTYVPPGFAHGFQTLAHSSEVAYQISEYHSAAHARGVRWDDPAFGITWPRADRIINDRDRSYPDFRPALVTAP